MCHHPRVPYLFGQGGQVGTVFLQRGGLVAAARSAAHGRAHGLLRLADHANDLRTDFGRIRAQRLKHACCNALALSQQAEKDVLGANVVVACEMAVRDPYKRPTKEDTYQAAWPPPATAPARAWHGG